MGGSMHPNVPFLAKHPAWGVPAETTTHSDSPSRAGGWDREGACPPLDKLSSPPPASKLKAIVCKQDEQMEPARKHGERGGCHSDSACA